MSAEVSLRLLPFFLVVGVGQFIIDAYIFDKWRTWLLKHGYSVWLYRLPRWCGWCMILLFPITVVLRQSQPSPSPVNRIFHYMLLMWYLPKIPLMAILLTRDILRFIIAYFTQHKILIKHCIEISARIGRFIANLPVIRSLMYKASKLAQIGTTTKSNIHSPQRRTFLQGVIKTGSAALPFAPVALLGHHAVYTLYDFHIHRVCIPVRNLPHQFEGLTITQISDIHAGSFFSDEPMQEIRRITNELKSDMLLITGDWVNWRAGELLMIMRELTALCANTYHPLGVWGCLGNHDHYSSGAEHQAIIDSIAQTGTQLLLNQHHSFAVDGAVLQLAGIDNIGLRQNFGDIPKALEGCSSDIPTILMAHDPTVWDKYVRGKTIGGVTVDVMLSGHTHGGQFGVQAFGFEFSPVSLMYKQSAGLYTDTDFGFGQQLYVNRGVGTTGIPLRIGIPPEITHITLQRA